MDQELLIKGLLELGIPGPEAYVPLFDTYLRELSKWNSAYNLTALRSGGEIVRKHFLDSLLYLTFIPPPVESGTVLQVGDIGSGAGFPGAPLGIVRPDLMITLIEPSKKKSAFLRHLVRTLGLKNITVARQRVEDMPPAVFDIAVTRALFSIGEMIRNAGHVLRRDGFFLLSKGPKVRDELAGLPAHCRLEMREMSFAAADLSRNIVKVAC